MDLLHQLAPCHLLALLFLLRPMDPMDPMDLMDLMDLMLLVAQQLFQHYPIQILLNPRCTNLVVLNKHHQLRQLGALLVMLQVLHMSQELQFLHQLHQ